MANEIKVYSDIYKLVEKARRERKAESNIDDLMKEVIDAGTPTHLNLPDYPERGILPVILNLSSLFTPLGKRYKRQIVEKVELVHLWKMCDIKYSGYQLDESDRDVLMAIIKTGMKERIGDTVTINRRRLLQMVRPNGKTFGSTDYDWLWESLLRLKFGVLEIDLKYRNGDRLVIGKRIAFSLLIYVAEDADSGKIKIRFDPRVAQLFEKNQYTLINTEKRAKLTMLLAKSIHSLISASKEKTQTYKLSFLTEKHGYHLPEYKVVIKLNKACEDLKQAGIIEGYEWNKSKEGVKSLTLVKVDDPVSGDPAVIEDLADIVE